jgi:hypothetical protein
VNEDAGGYRANYAYAWDVVEIGAPSALDRFCSLRLDIVTIAGDHKAVAGLLRSSDG